MQSLAVESESCDDGYNYSEELTKGETKAQKSGATLHWLGNDMIDVSGSGSESNGIHLFTDKALV
jgi:hypothetical protein